MTYLQRLADKLQVAVDKLLVCEVQRVNPRTGDVSTHAVGSFTETLREALNAPKAYQNPRTGKLVNDVQCFVTFSTEMETQVRAKLEEFNLENNAQLDLMPSKFESNKGRYLITRGSTPEGLVQATL